MAYYLRRTILLFCFITLVTFLIPQIQAQAAIQTFLSRSAWETAVSAFTNFEVPASPSPTSSFTLPSGITASSNLSLPVYPIGSGWATWSGGYTGNVLYTNQSTSTTITFSSPVYGFGLDMEPDPFSIYDMTLSLSDNSSLTQPVNGSSGAAFFGWTGADILSMTLSSSVDFAFGRMVEQTHAVPEPASLSLLGFGLLGLLGFKKKVS